MVDTASADQDPSGSLPSWGQIQITGIDTAPAVTASSSNTNHTVTFTRTGPIPWAVSVVAHSSGNHAQAVARAARVLGLRAVVVMPNDAPELKRARTEADGAEVIVCEVLAA